MSNAGGNSFKVRGAQVKGDVQGEFITESGGCLERSARVVVEADKTVTSDEAFR